MFQTAIETTANRPALDDDDGDSGGGVGDDAGGTSRAGAGI